MSASVRMFWNVNKSYILGLGILVLIACFTGVFSALKQGVSQNVIDFALFRFCRKEFSFLGFLLCRLFIFGGLLFLICFLRHKILGFLIYPIICVMAFCIGFDLYMICVIFGIGATFGIIFGIFICQIMYLVFFTVVAALILRQIRDIARFGKYCCDSYLKVFVVSIVILFVVAILQGTLIIILF